MTIVYRDELGIVEQELDPKVPITFMNGHAWCTSADGNSDMGIPMESIVEIRGF